MHVTKCRRFSYMSLISLACNSLYKPNKFNTKKRATFGILLQYALISPIARILSTLMEFYA